MSKIKLSSIVAMAQNRVIGNDNDLIWHIPEDLKHFKRTTMGKPMIMGRKTFESLGKPLPGRPHVIISRSFDSLPIGEPSQIHKDIEAQNIGETTTAKPSSSLHYAKSIEDGLELGKALAAKTGVDEAFVTGGGEIYRQTMDLIDRLYITVVHKNFDGDTTFPEFDWDQWKIVAEEKHEETDLPFTIFTLER